MQDWHTCLKKLQTAKEKGLSLTSHLVTASQNLYRTWRPRGFWVNIPRKRSSWLRTLQIWLLISGAELGIWWAQTRIKIYSLMSRFKQIVSRPLDGVLTIAGNTLQLVLAVLWLGGVPTYSLLTTHTQSKMRNLESRTFFYQHGNGFNLARYSVLCLVVLLLLL